MSSNPVPLQRGVYYHIYNRGNNRQNIFYEERNYHYFLQLYTKYVFPIADTYAYCLLPNHFHILVRIKTEQEQGELNLPTISCEPSQRFSNLFNAYSKTINNTYRRAGALFQRPFGRIPVTSDRYFTRLVVYIHRNPQRHGLVTNFRNWPFSSYHTLASAAPTHLRRDVLLEWFAGVEGMHTAHRLEIGAQDMRALVEDDEV